MLSFLIPAKNEAEYLPAAIKSIRITMSFVEMPYEIFVGDHGSTDGTADVIASNRALRVDCSACTTISQVRNQLANSATGDIFIFLDADVCMNSDWAKKFLALDMPLGVVWGSYPVSVSGGYMHRHWFRYLHRSYLGTGHMIVHKSDFFRIGKFNPNLVTGEDVDFCVRATKGQVLVRQQNCLRVIHMREPETVAQFFNRELWHGRGDWQGIKPKSELALFCAGFVFNFVLGLVFVLMSDHPAATIPLLCAMIQWGFLVMYKAPELRFTSVLPFTGLTFLYMWARALSIFQPNVR